MADTELQQRNRVIIKGKVEERKKRVNERVITQPGLECAPLTLREPKNLD